jgi:hypothetical protein
MLEKQLTNFTNDLNRKLKDTNDKFEWYQLVKNAKMEQTDVFSKFDTCFEKLQTQSNALQVEKRKRLDFEI